MVAVYLIAAVFDVGGIVIRRGGAVQICGSQVVEGASVYVGAAVCVEAAYRSAVVGIPSAVRVGGVFGDQEERIDAGIQWMGRVYVIGVCRVKAHAGVQIGLIEVHIVFYYKYRVIHSHEEFAVDPDRRVALFGQVLVTVWPLEHVVYGQGDRSCGVV